MLTFTIVPNKTALRQRKQRAQLQRDHKGKLMFHSQLFSFASLRICVLSIICFIPVTPQTVAVLTPTESDESKVFAERLAGELAEKLTVIDRAMSEAAFASVKTDMPFNLTAEASKAAGAAMGCDFFVLVQSQTLRRSSSKRPQYYESHAAIYAVSSRTGRLAFWSLPRFEADGMLESQRQLIGAAAPLASELVNKLKAAAKAELSEPPLPIMEGPPAEDSPLAKNFRTPIPYRRIKPQYTADAFLYDITATVDIIVDLDAGGSILRTRIVRWAGYGLDESVENAVRAMKWRPAERNGKPLPMRFLLRYNFRKIEKE